MAGDGELSTELQVGAAHGSVMTGHVGPVPKRWGQRGLLSEVGELLEAIEQDGFHLVYQPVVDLASQRVVGVESLLRWHRANGEQVSPERVVAFAEQYGVSIEITGWVFNRAIQDALVWRKQGLGLEMAINASAGVVSDPESVGPCLELLGHYGYSPSWLTVEVTESDVIRNPDGVRETLRRLRDAGVGVAIDDFGSGNSNLLRLQHLPFNQIKIDKSLVSQANDHHTSARLVNFVAMLGQGLGLVVVAEGVEDQPTVDLLRRSRIERAQGFHFAKPVAAEQVPQTILDIERRLRLSNQDAGTEPNALETAVVSERHARSRNATIQKP
jgi:EAL domain-containing protein (putative c-di-GMP-specific phosphodiesterase class I)